ncbi:unnamed protein product [Hermetia illucens]|uniref:Uncharacterized protein n=1 Tax=Hermetia illucens TaxID=343691 RepID=A0A7R8UCU8_HERIL|nr:unnamed protein product [Hermetia illucens]
MNIGTHKVNTNSNRSRNQNRNIDNRNCQNRNNQNRRINYYEPGNAKREKINGDQYYYPTRACVIQGVTGIKTKTLGTTQTKVYFNPQVSIERTLRIVANDFSIEVDAILGLDFHTKVKAIINYDSWMLTINTSDGPHELPIFDGPDTNTILIAPRSEVILYSLDLGPVNYHLFNTLKNWQENNKIVNNEEVINITNVYFDELDGLHYKNGISAYQSVVKKAFQISTKRKLTDVEIEDILESSDKFIIIPADESDSDLEDVSHEENNLEEEDETDNDRPGNEWDDDT